LFGPIKIKMNSASFVLALGGDVMIGRTVNKAISDHGYSYPWGDLLPVLTHADAVIVNLETTMTHSDRMVPKMFNFKATPDKVQTLSAVGVTAVALANNHILDFSEEGLAETLRTLQSARIPYTGAGLNEAEAATPVFIHKSNYSIGLISYTDNEPTWKAGPQKCGTNYIAIANKQDQQKVLSAVRQLRREVDLLVVSLHWGPNMRIEPPPLFVDFAHQLVDQGADIIHGHSAHIFQAVEVYRHKLILYDTGDLVDDYVVDPELRNDLSFLFLAELRNGALYRLKLIPTAISRYQANLAQGSDFNWSLKHIQQLSARHATVVSNEGEVLL
jgi:poly-gamma-glutamate capsule biosynthesis protein CapA/YwtB (metallophosphatase superfamily)